MFSKWLLSLFLIIVLITLQIVINILLGEAYLDSLKIIYWVFWQASVSVIDKNIFESKVSCVG